MAAKSNVVRAATRFIGDGFYNFMARFGVLGADKNAGNTYTYAEPDQQEIEAAYRTSLFKKAVNAPADDIVREWRDWQAEDDQIEVIEAEEARLDLRRKTRSALRWSRLYGGSIMVFGMRGEDTASELVPDRVRQGSLEFVHVLHRWQVQVPEIERDPMSPNFGGPIAYDIPQKNGGVALRVHPSRVIRFIGDEIPDGAITAIANQGWGDSLWTVLKEACTNAGLSASIVVALLQEAKTDVVNVPGLMENLATADYEALLLRRFGLAQAAKGVNSVLLLDGEEVHAQKTINFSGLPDVVKTLLMILCAVADVPATRMLGKAPDGMNSTGESDMRNYYDMLSSRQETDLRPTLTPLDEVMLRSALGSRPDEVHYEWSPLWQMTAVEKATHDKTVADTIKTIADTNVLPGSAMATVAQNRLIEDGVFPGLEAALADAEAEGDVAMVAEQLTPEEQAAAETERAIAIAQAKPAPAAGAAKKPKLRVVGRDGFLIDATPAMLLADMRPRSLYVRRNVVNAAEIIAWAKSHGFETVVQASDLHVTIVYSREPVDWMKMGDDWAGDEQGRVRIKPGGPRAVEPLGPNGAVVLLFANFDLQWRHERLIAAGARSEYPDYQPHITISFAADGQVPARAIADPYRGEIVLGPEIFEEVKDDFRVSIVER